MKLTIIGNFALAHSWKNELADDAELIGWDVTRLQDDQCSTNQVIEHGEQSDWVLWARTHNRNPVGDIPKTFTHLRHKGVPVVGLHLDLYVGVAKREKNIGVDDFWQCEYMATADGDPRHAQYFRDQRIQHLWCPPATGSARIRQGRHRDDMACDVAFVGIRRHLREWPDRANLVDALTKRYGQRFRWYCGKSPFGNVQGQDFADACTSARVIVGDSANPGHDLANYWSDRIPRTLAVGATFTHPHVRGLEAQGFTPHVMDYWRYGDMQSLFQSVDSLIERDTATMRAAGIEAAKRHTWKTRLPQLAAVVL